MHGRRRAGAPPWARVVPLALVVTLGATACSGGSSGGPAAATASAAPATAATGAPATPAYPVVLVPQAENILDKVDAALAAATRSGKVADADGRVVGPYAQRLAAELAVRGRAGASSATASPTASPTSSPTASPSPTASHRLHRVRDLDGRDGP